jgi:WD40 repeat protein
MRTGEAVSVLTTHEGSITSVAFAPDESRIVSGCEDGMVRIFDTSIGKVVAKFKGYATVTSVAFSPDGLRIAAFGQYVQQIWDIRTGELIGSLPGHGGSLFISGAFSPDGSRIVSRSSTGIVAIWDASSRMLITGDTPGANQLKQSVQPVFHCDQETGWLSLLCPDTSSTVRLCWIPFARRSRQWSIDGYKLPIALNSSSSGKVALGTHTGGCPPVGQTHQLATPPISPPSLTYSHDPLVHRL